MSRWQHSDEDCPRRPLFGRRHGRRYECRKCGRVWQAVWHVPSIARLSGTWRWRLIDPHAPEEPCARCGQAARLHTRPGEPKHATECPGYVAPEPTGGAQ